MVEEPAIVAVMVEQLVPLVALVVGISLPTAAIIVWITFNYRRRSRLMELYHEERMAAIERGMDVPPLPQEVLHGRSLRPRRSSLLPGLVWFFIGVALMVMMQAADDPAAAYSGLIPLGVGVAYLIYHFVEGRKLEPPDSQQQAPQAESLREP